ncbi:retinoic acid-induced protein 1 [Gouania willdenowi]|uniref:retinoic acid-induced protein 1 n=1 Tax=Gouania willdenowi TaxID=441366 RepID=UPI001055C800|nr:retinoic acid-induced protein 1 [Gouania willdenowi]XP_028310314.1 retinoic acid-induced protein 1 [Gouania willdenowi]
MQSFRERSGGYHSNQPCYQQEHHELSRLETYRQHPHHPQHPGPSPHSGPGPGHTRPSYETHSLANPTGMAPAGGPGIGGGQKDCYSQQSYLGYPGNDGGSGPGNGGSAPSQPKKAFRGSKVPPPNPNQHLQGPGSYSNHMSGGNYSAQYVSEGHLQQKWEDPRQIAQYDQEMVGRLEGAGTPAPSSQYIDQNMLGNSQDHCQQSSTPAYRSPHQQPHPPNPSPAPLMYPQSHLHYPQHSPSPSSYMEKFSPMPQCYKGFSIPSNSQYNRQMSTHSNLKQVGYRSNSYGYQPPSSRAYEQQPSLQGMGNPQEPHSKYQHFSQPQQNYCLSELSVRSPEQYYQTCSPSSSHSPARSVGRSPSYSSTPSPLMTNPESFQYGQPPMTPGAASSASSSSAGMQEQASTNTMLIPPRSHPSPSVQHAASHSYTTTPQVTTMKERFSEKLLANPSLWSLNALTSQVENISNNVQQLLLSEALVANKKAGKRSSGGSNSSAGSGASSKKGEEYKSPPYPEGGGSVSGGLMQDPYTTSQHHPLPMELHEGGYSSSSDEQLERGYYYYGQGRSPAQALNNTQLSMDTASSCSMASPDDMSTRSGDSGLHNLTPEPTRCQSVQGADGMSTPVKSIGDERSPTSITMPSPMIQENDSPSDIQQVNDPVKENFEESAWTEKSTDKEELTTERTSDIETHSDTTKSTEKLESWSDEDKSPAVYGKVNMEVTERDYCNEMAYQRFQRNYNLDVKESERSPAVLSDSSQKGTFGQELKSEMFKSESPSASESSEKTLPFTPCGEIEHNQYSTEKEDSSTNTSPTPRVDELEDGNSDMGNGRDLVNEEEEEDRGEECAEKQEQKDMQQTSSSPSLVSAEDQEEQGDEDQISLSLTKEAVNIKAGPEKTSTDIDSRTEGQSTEIHADHEFTGALAHPNPAAIIPATGASAMETAIGDTAPQPQSAMPVFSALNDKSTPLAQGRDHIDHSDAKVLEPDSPQLPGKSILPSAPSWANTPPSPKKGDEDMEPGISCASAVTPLAKPEPVAPSAHPRAFGRKHARGRRRILQSAVGLRRQLSLERELKEDEKPHSPVEKPDLPPSKTMLYSDEMDLVHQESIGSQTSKMIADGFSSRMCTRSFNALELVSKAESPVKRKPGPKPGSRQGHKPGPKPGAKPGPKPGLKHGLKSGPKPGMKPSPKILAIEPEQSLKIETSIKRKPGPKPGLKPRPNPGLKSGYKPCSKPGSKPAIKPGPKTRPKSGLNPIEVSVLPDTAPIKAPVGRPKGSVSKTKLTQEEPLQHSVVMQSRSRKSSKTPVPQVIQGTKPKLEEDTLTDEEIKGKQGEQKNMVLRSRKPSQDKLPKEKVKGEVISSNASTELKACDVSFNEEDIKIVEHMQTSISDTVTNIVIPSDPMATTTVPIEESNEKALVPVKHTSSPELPVVQVKKKRGPKPKLKPSPLQPTKLEDVVSDTQENVRGSKKKQGPAKKSPVVIPVTKDTPLNISGLDSTSDVPLVPTQCPTRTKVLPPRKGRGQKYEAMVQKITSPSSKKHLPITQLDSNLIDEVAVKVSSEPEFSKESEISTLINNAEVTESTQEGGNKCLQAERNNDVTEQNKEHELSQELLTTEVVTEIEKEEFEKKDETKQENVQPESQQDGIEDKVFCPVKEPLEVNTPGEWGIQSPKSESADTSKSTRTKRKRWAMVESTDVSVVALEAGGLIITTPRLAKQRAIKNNHEMHLKQRRKKRKDISTAEDSETADMTATKEPDQKQIVNVSPAESKVPLPMSADEIVEAAQKTSVELIQKPRRGRKPSTNLTERKRSKTSPPDSIPGKQVKVYKKPGPKPGMKDAIEVIEAVVRAAGCEQAEKEEKGQKEIREKEPTEKHEPCDVGPVVTITEKETDTVSVKRIRRKTLHQTSRLAFCPYVRINNSRDFSSWCAVVNKPEDAVVFQRRRKKGILRMRNPFTVAKIVPHTAAMLQGPMVNKLLLCRELTCSLCGKPANYKDLGDLCGPYYTEDAFPRKILTEAGPSEHFREESKKTYDNNINSKTEDPGIFLKSDCKGNAEKEESKHVFTQEGGIGRRHHWGLRRAARTDRTGVEGFSKKVTLRERFRRMQQLQAQRQSSETTGDSEGSDSFFQRLQIEAEAKEHWTHENCVIWTKGIIMIAGRLYGLTEAAKNSAQTSCYKCQITGASLSCCWRGCSHKYHYVCAKEIGCTFHEDDFSIKCPKHEDL